MVTYRVWAEAKKGDDYYYRTTSKKTAGKLAQKLAKKDMLNSVVRNTRKGEVYLKKDEVKQLILLSLKRKKMRK